VTLTQSLGHVFSQKHAPVKRRARCVDLSDSKVTADTGNEFFVLRFFGIYPAMGVALYRRGVMDNLAR